MRKKRQNLTSGEKEFIVENYGTDLTPKEIATYLGMTARQLNSAVYYLRKNGYDIPLIKRSGPRKKVSFWSKILNALTN